MKNRKYLFAILLICLIFFAPFFLSPSLLIFRDNDLGRQYVPLFTFLRETFLKYQQIPLWYPNQMMGETLIGNPWSSLSYPINFIFLIFPIKFGVIFYFLLHFILAGFFTFWLAKSYKLSNISSFAAALFYTFSTKMLLHLSAGHITMITAFSYFPLVFLSIRNLNRSQNFWIIVGSISLAFMYMTYPTIFYYSVIFILIYWIYHLLIDLWATKNLNLAKVKRQIVSVSLVFVITLGLLAIILVPQLEFAPLSTRLQLRLEDVALPLWNLKRFLTSLLIPYLNFDSFDHESFLYLGAVPTLLAFIGFWRLSFARKIILAAIGILTLLFVAGLSTPLFGLAFNFLPFLKYSRITTRPWFAVALVVAILATLALEKIKNKKIIYLLIIFFLVESFFIGYRKIFKISNLSFSNQSLYQYLTNDKDIFRVYCTTYCFNPQLISRNKIQILNGETPIQDARFVKFLSDAGNYQYLRFAVIFPPYQVWQKDKPPIPNADLLGLANVKYVASTYLLPTEDLDFIDQFDKIYLYLNKRYKPRVFFEGSDEDVKVLSYSPNRIALEFNPVPDFRNLIIADNYYPDWFAYTNYQKFNVEKYQSIFRKVSIPPNSQSLELKYQPESFKLGRTITFITIFILILWYIHKQRLAARRK